MRPVPGVVLKYFTASDIVPRWDVVGAHTRATVTTAAGFLDCLIARMPFPVRAIQADGSPEFQGRPRGGLPGTRHPPPRIAPPRSPKLNGCVERAQRTHTEEFYEGHPLSLEIAALLAWERTYNTVPPHQALGYITPAQFLYRWTSQRKEAECH